MDFGTGGLRGTAHRMIAGEWQRGRAIWEPRSIATLPSSSCGSPRALPWRPRGTWGATRRSTADQAAVDSMRRSLGFVDMDGVVVIGEGEKDEAPMLYIGEQVGNGNPPAVDVAVDPIDGTRLVARGIPGGIATVALAERGSMFHTHLHYMEKLIVGPAAAKVIDITAPRGAEPQAHRQGRGSPRRGPDGRRARPRAARDAPRGDPLRRRAGEADHGRRRRGRPHGGDGAPHRHRRAHGYRRRA